MKVEFLVDTKDLIVLRDLINGNIRVIKDKPILRDIILGSFAVTPVLSKSIKHKVEIQGKKYSDLLEFKSGDMKIGFIDKSIVDCKEIIDKLDEKRLFDIYKKGNDIISSGEFQNVVLSILPYDENRQIYRIDDQEDDLIYSISKDASKNVSNIELANMEGIADIFLKQYGIFSYEDSKDGMIFGSKGRILISSGSPIKEIIERKVLEYGKKY